MKSALTLWANLEAAREKKITKSQIHGNHTRGTECWGMLPTGV